MRANFKRFPPPAFDQSKAAGIAGNYLKGLTTLNKRLVLILDLEAVLNLEKDESLATSLSEVIANGGAEPALATATP